MRQLVGGTIDREKNARMMILNGAKTCKSCLIELDKYAKSAGVADLSSRLLILPFSEPRNPARNVFFVS